MALNFNKINRNAGLAPSSIMDSADISAHKEESVKTITPIPRNLIAYHEANDYRELDSDETIEQLADAIARQGLLDNLVVVERKSRMPGNDDKKYVLVSGERRLRAINLLAERSDEMATKFATVPCNVKTEEYFRLAPAVRDRLHDEGRDDAEIRAIQEQILIDEANLQRRGGVGDERLQRMAAARYSDNVRIIFGISQKDADKLTAQISGQNIRTIERSLKIERSLLTRIKDLLDADLISKDEAARFSVLEAADQEAVAQALGGLVDLQLPARGNPTPELVKARKALSDALAKRNDKERRAALNAALRETMARVEALREAQRPTPHKNNSAKSARERYTARISGMEAKVRSLSSDRSVKEMAALDRSRTPDEAAVVDQLDKLIDDLRALKKKIQQAAKQE